MKIFNVIKGNNGATYICNTKNWESIQYSLKFYKARTIKANVLKQGMQCYLFIKGLLFSNKLKSSIEINQYLQQISHTNTSFYVDAQSSVLISPTKDKIIVHHHDDYFQKFAFGESYVKVKNEAKIYGLFNTNIEHFQVSEFFDSRDEEHTFCSFKLSNAKVRALSVNSKPLDLVVPLIEFFKLTQGKTTTAEHYLNTLLAQLNVEPSELLKPTIDELIRLKNNYGKIAIPLGLVHRDFKPWNVLYYQKPLIFDFEETIIDGSPLEDLFNYLIDPIIMYKTTEEVSNFIFNKQNIKSYKLYLSNLNLQVDFELFLKIYLSNRILFWKADNKHNTSIKYLELLNHISKKYAM